MTTIRSRDNAFVKQLIALTHSSRERKKTALTVLDGVHLASAYCDNVGAPQSVAVAESARDSAEVRALLARVASSTVRVLSDDVIAEASTLASASTLLAVVSTPVASPTPTATHAVLVLEDIQDPGNMGSMLRSAAAAGVREVVCSPTTAFAWAPKVLRAGQGAHFSLNIAEGIDVLAFVRAFTGQALALVPAAEETIYQRDLTQPTAWLVGNEGAGLSPALLLAAAARLAIPMPGKVESLNAAAAAAIALFEMVRQRGQSR